MLFLSLIFSLTIFTFTIEIEGKYLNERNLRNIFNICYDEYGCFTTLPPFGGTFYRPIASLPQSPTIVATRFFLYTRENRSGIEIGREKTGLGLGSWNRERMTRFVIHGMIETYQAEWYNQMRQALLEYEDSNIIFVDWSKTNQFPYNQASSNTQIVGAEVALVINELISKYQADRDLIHIIGHSLGAHAAGYAGSRVKPLISRITGLDPAGPFFEFTEPNVRLDQTDAQFVDVIHTDGEAHIQLGLGLLQPLGHADFYPNGGLEQPSCPKMLGKIFNSIINAFDGDGFSQSVLCSHLFSVYVFIDSIKNKNCSYLSYLCNSMDEMKINDQCYQNQRNQMGIKASPLYQGRFYLKTQNVNEYPFCQHLYSITLTIGKQNLLLLGKIEIIFQNQSILFEHSFIEKNPLLSSSDKNITRILPINQSLTNLLFVQLNLKYLPNDISQPISLISIKDIENETSLTFCPTKDKSFYFQLC